MSIYWLSTRYSLCSCAREAVKHRHFELLNHEENEKEKEKEKKKRKKRKKEKEREREALRQLAYVSGLFLRF